MPLFWQKLDSITIDSINNLVSARESENSYLEYKEALPDLFKNDEKFEFLHDITAFANAAGGDIIYGISEKRDEKGNPTGIPEKILGIGVANRDQLQQQIESIILSCTEPPYRGIQFYWLDDIGAKPILILRITRGWAKPYAVRVNEKYRVSVRTQTGKRSLGFKEICDMAINSATLIDRVRTFRESRIELLNHGNLPIGLGKPLIMLQMIPAANFETKEDYPAKMIKDKSELGACLPIWNTNVRDYRYNLDGYILVSEVQPTGICGYLQFFRNGIVESTNNGIFEKDENRYLLPSYFEKCIIIAFKQYLDYQNSLGISLPIFIHLSLLGFKNVSLYKRKDWLSDPFDRNEIFLETIVEDYSVNPATQLKPIFDSIWNAAGIAESPNYDKDGNYKEKLN